MAKKIKVLFDKKLNKHHIEYHRLKDMTDYRFKVFQQLNSSNDLAVMIETHLGSVTKPEQLNYSRTLEGLFAKYNLGYYIKPMEVQNTKNLLGLFPSAQKTITHFSITFVITKGQLTRDLFDALMCEFDLQVGYNMTKPIKDFFDDLQKGYTSTVLDPDYFSASFYDSRIFNKFLASEDISKIIK